MTPSASCCGCRGHVRRGMRLRVCFSRLILFPVLDRGLDSLFRVVYQPPLFPLESPLRAWLLPLVAPRQLVRPVCLSLPGSCPALRDTMSACLVWGGPAWVRGVVGVVLLPLLALLGWSLHPPLLCPLLWGWANRWS